MFAKLAMCLRHLLHMDRMKGYLGEKVFNNIFPTQVTMIAAQKPAQKFTRIFDGEIVGERIADSDSKVTPVMEKTMCPHPAKRDNKKIFQRGGNQSDKMWWVCKDCHARWRRYPMSKMLELEPDDDSEVSFGRHMGKKFLQLETEDPSYCKWVIQTYETDKTMCEGLQHLAEYLLHEEWEIAKLPKSKELLTTSEKLDMELDDLL